MTIFRKKNQKYNTTPFRKKKYGNCLVFRISEEKVHLFRKLNSQQTTSQFFITRSQTALKHETKVIFPIILHRKKNTSSFLSSIQKNVSKYYVDFIIGRKTDTFKDCHGLFKQTDLPQRIYRQT